MPRSQHRIGGYASAVEEEEEVICPYNKQHRIPVSLIQQHLAVCRKGLQAKNGSDVRVCPYNRNHHVSAAKYNEHVENCPDASFEDDNGYGNGDFERMERGKQRNGHSGHEDPRTRPSHLKQSGPEARHVEQFAASKGFKVGKGFGFTKEQEDGGNFVRERSFRNPRNENVDNFDDHASYDRTKKPYARSKSNVEMDEDSVRRAQRNVVDQVREFQNSFNQRPSASRNDESDRFTKLRDQAPFVKQAPPPQPHHQDHGYEEPPLERRGGYGRGRKVVEHEELPRPGGIWNRIRSEEECVQPEYKEEPISYRESVPTSGRFKIMKASNVFGPIEAAAPATNVVGKRISSVLEEEDWGSGEKMRTFPILKPSDVFRLDDMDMGDRRGRRDDGNFVRDYHHYGHESMARPNRRFDVKHPDDVFTNGRQAIAPRFARSRTPPEVREEKKAELPWPFSRFAENPNLGRRSEDETKNQESSADVEAKFPKTDAAARMSPMEKINEVRNEILVSMVGNGEEDEVKSYGQSDCEILSVSSGGRASKRLDSSSPPSHAWDREGSEIWEATASAGPKPKVLSIYEQYEQFGLDDDDFLKPAEPVEPLTLPDPNPNMGAIYAHLRNFGFGTSPVGVVQSPAFGSSHSSSPYSFAP